jgi:predicted DNA-binding protein (UPF0251 family)
MTIEFIADGVKVYPPTVDKSQKVIFTVGEYQATELMNLYPLQSEEANWKVTVERYEA